MKSKILIISLCCLLYNYSLIAQEQCKVLKSDISEKYTGKCKKGLAHGRGIAEGKDKYEGYFKNGLPDGKGKYTWSNGDIYDGYWKNGKRNGEGKFIYKKNNVDSVKYGKWENDVFVKRLLPPQYKIIKSTSVSRYMIQNKGKGNRVLFSFMQAGANNDISNLLFEANSGSSYELGTKKGFDNVVFPFTCKLSYTSSNLLHTFNFTVEFEIEIFEPGDWDIVLNN